MVSVGATLGPLLTKPFLPELQPTGQQHGGISSTNWTLHNHGTWDGNETNRVGPVYEQGKGSGFVLGNFSGLQSNETLVDMSDVGKVRFAYVLYGSFMMPSALLFGLLSITSRRKHGIHSTQVVASPKGLPKIAHLDTTRPCFKRTFIGTVSACVYLIFSIEFITGLFLAPIVVQGLGWPNQMGSWVTAVYFASHTTGRLVGVPLALRLSPWVFLLCDLVLMAVGLVLMLFASHNDIMLWISVVVTGLGVSTFHASLLAYTANYLLVTGWAGAALSTGMTAAQISFPALAGNLLEWYGYLATVYCCLSHLGMLALCLATTQIVVWISHSSRKPQLQSGSDPAAIEPLQSRAT